MKTISINFGAVLRRCGGTQSDLSPSSRQHRIKASLGQQARRIEFLRHVHLALSD
ncbi:MAG: hypothetical protein NTZ94_01945 [Verrucomicrobia bacterium]|nr:hypothetical protein [Verrucomicrobiota bacterium]